MRVALDLRSVHPGLTGIGRYAANLCLSLDQVEAPIEVHGITTPSGKEYLKGMTGAPLHVVAGGPGWDEFGLPDLLRTLRADVYHSPLFVLPKVRACTYICTIHDVIPLARPDLTSPGFSQFFHAHMSHALKSARHIVAVSEFTRIDLLRHFPVDASRVTVIHEPVSPLFCRRPQARSLAVIKELGLQPGFILSVGAIDRRKNLARLIQAYDLLRRRSDAPPLAVVRAPSGDDIYLAAEVSSRGLDRNVRMLGRVSDDALSHLYSTAACFVFPSLYEGFGLPVLEAMASGTPVVTSRSSSLPEVAGGAALLVNPTDPVGIRDAIEILLVDGTTRERLIEAGIVRAANFSPKKQGAQLSELYARIVRDAA
jgi:glycosyltransferase involved in cell wall biosynthesis